MRTGVFAGSECLDVTDEDQHRLRRKNKVELEKLPNDDARSARVAELNVQQSIEVLKQHPAIKRAIAERGLSLHGLIYDIGAGQLKILE